MNSILKQQYIVSLILREKVSELIASGMEELKKWREASPSNESLYRYLSTRITVVICCVVSGLILEKVGQLIADVIPGKRRWRQSGIGWRWWQWSCYYDGKMLQYAHAEMGSWQETWNGMKKFHILGSYRDYR